MATIRVADPAHAGDEPSQPSGDDESPVGPGFSKSLTKTRSHQEDMDIHESIINIRSHSWMPERISSRISAEQPDDDPGLRNPGDFKQRQVGNAKVRDR
jgi:KUP system potassium uptake protein